MAENKSSQEKQMIIHLWACPRTLSTATMYSFSQRPDTIVLDEPLYASHISKCPHLNRPYREQLLTTYETDGNKVLKDLQSKFQPGKNIIFCKQITKQLLGIDKELLYGDNIRHIFLVRDPLDIIGSWSDRQEIHNEGCNLENLCFPQMVQLYSEIRQRTGTSPIIIDSNMLKTHAREVWTEVCSRLCIPFFEEQLSWPAGPKPDIDGLWAPYWYEQVHKSTGYGTGIDSSRNEQSSLHMSLPVLSGDKLEVYRECLPFAELLLSRAVGKDLLCPHTSRPDVPRSYQLPNTGNSEVTKIQKPVLGDPRNQNTLAWIGEKLYPRELARVSVFDSSVQGGDAVWEGLRIYNYKIFKLEEHLDRLFHSAKAIAFTNVPSRAFIKMAIFKTLQVNGMFDNTHIRLTLTRGVKITSSMNPHFNVFGTTLIVLPEWKPPVNPTTYDNDKGISLITVSGRRNQPQCLDSKIHHNNLLNNILPKIQANLAGAADALILDVDGFVSETNATNVFMISQGRLYTPYADACLPGITRQTVIDIAKSLGISIEEKRLSLTEFYIADEVFTTGTMGELTPVVTIDGRMIGNFEEGTEQAGPSKWPVLSRIQQSFRYLTETEGVPIPH